MSRKILKSMEREGQRRRSPRISALGCKANNQNRQISRTRTRMKRKVDDTAFTPVSKLAKQVWKGRDSQQNADNSADFLEWRSVLESRKIKENQKHDDHANGKPSIMPAKHILELVLDTLQRRDNYEIFAEPVDPDEVEDYCDIIKEPMDFGTMRAKLHEGMYKNLEQFEHDVFLIPENAMHFNSSATVYFRQGRAIHELAKKVFHVLKTDPENFESEFSGTRRRSMRKALSETKDSRFSLPKSSDVYSQQCPSTSTFRRTNKKNPSMIDHFQAKNFLNGSKEGILSSSEIADRRLTYLYLDKKSVDSTSYSGCKPLVLMNQGDISYKDSLMSYVKDLGATAQMVAKRKLLGQHESRKHQIGTEKCSNSGGFIPTEFKTFRDFTGSNPFLKASNAVIDFTKEREAAANCRDKGKERTDTDNDHTLGKEKNEMLKTVSTRNNHVAVGKDLSCSTSKSNDNARPVILALENAHSSVAEFKSRIKRNGAVPRPITKAGPSCDEAQQQPLPVVSQFTFDLSFLKARLNQMNAGVERGAKLRC